MRPDESRRLTGASLSSDRPGAAAEVLWEPGDDATTCIGAWSERVRAACAALDLEPPVLRVRDYARGATLGFEAPADRLYAATTINDWALGADPLDAALPGLRAAVDEEASPRLVALLAEAERRGVEALWDDEGVSLGLGARSRMWALDALPAPADVDWSALGRVPVALVTGTHGKSTTTRLLARCMEAAGWTVGSCTTDGIRIAGEDVEHGDWTGPGAARRVLRDPRVGAAALETARGGLLRRGLALRSADVAVLTNIAADHLGEWGVDDVPALGRAKWVVTRAVGEGGWVVLNAEDPTLTALAETLAPGVRIGWFSIAPGPSVSRLRPGDAALTVRDGWIVRAGDGEAPIVRVDSIPLAFGGVARFNVENALAAAGAALALGIPPERVAEGLASLTPDPTSSPGRQNAAVVGGVTVLLDFGHNPHGVRAVLDFARAWHPGGQHIAIVGQAGDRPERALADLAHTLVEGGVTRVVLRPLHGYLRGRSEWEIPELLARCLLAEGLPEGAIARAGDEPSALALAIDQASPGDLVLVLVHVEREAVRALLDERGAAWLASGSVGLTSGS